MTRSDLVAFHRTWFKPNHATVTAVGDITMSELKTEARAGLRGLEAGRYPGKEYRDGGKQAATNRVSA